MQGLLLVFLLLLSLFMIVGINHSLAELTFLKMVPSSRTFFVLGIANIYLMILFLNDPRKYFPETPAWRIMVFLTVLLVISAISILFNRFTNHFFKPWEVAAVTIAFSIVVWLLLYKKVIPFTLLMLALVIYTTYDVFPVTSGTDAITGKKMYRFAREIQRKDPYARWVVFNSNKPSALLIAAGAEVFNEPKYTPDLQSLKILDPETKYFRVYNMYANSMVKLTEDTTRIIIQRTSPAHYAIEVSPRHQHFRKLGIKYLVFPADSVSDRYAASQGCTMEKLNETPLDGFNFYEVTHP